MIRARALGAAAVLAAATVGTAALALPLQLSFPHEEHAGLFPVCTGCHAGIPRGDAATVYPDSLACARCHDGTELERVPLVLPADRDGILVFSHPEHVGAVARAGDARLDCAACHRAPGSAERMDVEPATAERCLGCHAHEAPEHLAEGRECATCHRPLGESPELDAGRIRSFPAPATHEAEGFLSAHDPGPEVGRCATCHARESCTRCHLNGDALEPVTALAPDARVATLAAERAPEYPTPESHRGSGWRWGHGPAASEEGASCANCHAASGCFTCHREGTVSAADRLPRAGPDDPRGVVLAEGVVHPPGFTFDHAAPAGAGEACTSCHADDFCASCHAAATRPAFHLPGFLETHGPEAYRSASDCASCHSTEVFCRSCHAELGMADQDRAGVTFHTARPFWLFGHGIAARQGLEGCVSCHTQSDCAACHSSFLGWGVNPHGSGWDGSALRDANPFACAPCHLGGVPR